MANIQTISINRIYKVKEFDLLTIANKVGNMYLCMDTGKMYYDETLYPDGRKPYTYTSVRTVNDLMYNITPAMNVSYYVWEDNSLWLWQNKWITLYSDITYPSAYIYDDTNRLKDIYRYDNNPNYPADDNGLLKDGSVIVRDKNRIIKGKLYIDDGQDNLVISGYFGGGLRFLPNGKQNTQGELYIADEGYSYIRSQFRIINDEAYIDYSQNPEYDTSEYENDTHLYKVYHEGNLDTSAIKVMTPRQIYDKLLDSSLPSPLGFNVAQLNGKTDSDFADVNHTHTASQITDFNTQARAQADVELGAVLNNISGNGVSSSFNTVTKVLTLDANNFNISLTDGVTGSATVNRLNDVSITARVDPTKHIHQNYIDTMANLQSQIDDIEAEIDMSQYPKFDDLNDAIDSVKGTINPTVGKPLLINQDLTLPANAITADALSHNITLELLGDITGQITFDGSETDIQLSTTLDASNPAIEQLIDSKLQGRTYTGLIGDGISTDYIVSHNLNTQNIIVQFRQVSDNKQVILDNSIIDNNRISITTQTILSNDSIKVLIYKM